MAVKTEREHKTPVIEKRNIALRPTRSIIKPLNKFRGEEILVQQAFNKSG